MRQRGDFADLISWSAAPVIVRMVNIENGLRLIVSRRKFGEALWVGDIIRVNVDGPAGLQVVYFFCRTQTA